jgi:hypothetical protein
MNNKNENMSTYTRMNYTSLARNGTISAKRKEAHTTVRHTSLTQKKLSVRDQPALLNQNYVHEEIKSKLKSESACYHSI